MDKPKVTIAVIPRERFSITMRSLESIYEETDSDFSLVYVDGNSPPHVAAQLRQQSLAKNFRLLRYDRYLSPNQARNIAIKQCDTEYIVFVDNDVFFRKGWLNALVECAQATDCAMVAPLYLHGPLAADIIHTAGGEAHIERRPGGNYYVQDHFLEGRKASEMRSQLKRMPISYVEFHTLLVRKNLFDEIGLLDEKLLNMGEENDFCLNAISAGKQLYFEPESVIAYDYTLPFEWSDIPFFLLRWGPLWTQTSEHRMIEKWNLAKDDPFIGHVRHFCVNHRKHAKPPARELTALFGKSIAAIVQRVLFKLIREATEFSFRCRTAMMLKDGY